MILFNGLHTKRTQVCVIFCCNITTIVCICFIEVLLAAYSVNNIVSHSPSASISARPSHTHVSKSMITNASFRTKKLPGE